jgi:hypothetical protein
MKIRSNSVREVGLIINRSYVLQNYTLKKTILLVTC